MQVIITGELVILNNYKGPRQDIINLVLVILKQFVYAQKCFAELPKFAMFMSKLSQWYFIDKCHAAKLSREEKCENGIIYFKHNEVINSYINI